MLEKSFFWKEMFFPFHKVKWIESDGVPEEENIQFFIHIFLAFFFEGLKIVFRTQGWKRRVLNLRKKK